MLQVNKQRSRPKKFRTELVEEMLPRFETFLENREKYIKALETTIDLLKGTLENRNLNNLAIRNSIDELVVMQRLSNTISTAVTPEAILNSLIDLSKQVVPLCDANIFLLDDYGKRITSLPSSNSERLVQEAQEQIESGVVDWVLSEKKTVIIPDTKSLMGERQSKNFVIVPLFMRNKGIGFYLIHTEKAQKEFSNQDIQLLTVLANQAAVGVENWRTYYQLILANKELKSNEAQLIQAARFAAIGELSTSIVHEIKNPIQVLMLQLDVMKRGTKIPNAEEKLRLQVERLHQITRRLMNFARKASDEFVITPTNVNKALLDVIAMVEHEYRLENIEFEIDLEDQLPRILGNASYLQQVFLNLAMNAHDAMPKGGKIKIITSSDSSLITVKFSDTGTGIDPQIAQDIFKPFFSTKEEGKGTGLGLTISRKIIVQHEGQIIQEGEVGKGTTFIIKFPIRRSGQ